MRVMPAMTGARERGDGAVLGACGLVVGLILALIAIDLSGALLVAAHEDNALEVAADAVAQPEFELVLKNTDEWPTLLAERITSSLEAYGLSENGDADGVRIAMYEKDPSDSRYRVIVWSAEVTRTFEPVWFPAEDGKIAISRVKTGTIILYSSSQTYGRSEKLSEKSGYAVSKGGSLSVKSVKRASIERLCGSRGADMACSDEAASQMQEALSKALAKCE